METPCTWQQEHSLPYNPQDIDSIYTYAQRLRKRTLGECIGKDRVAASNVCKGSFGSALEQEYFFIPANSRAGADFELADLELKTTPVRSDKSGILTAKERLVLGMINYDEIIEEEWETSTLFSKAAKMLLVAYLYQQEINPIYYQIILVRLWGLQPGDWGIQSPHTSPSRSDLVQLRKDWELIAQKVRRGEAHLISGGDTVYLEACTKSRKATDRRRQPNSAELAKPRAWALKASYLTAVLNPEHKSLQEIKRLEDDWDLDLLGLVKKRFSPFFGKSEEELAQYFGLDYSSSRKPKNLTDMLTKRVLGIKPACQIAEFEKAGIKAKTLRLRLNGSPKEAVSLPSFRYTDMVNTSFESSDFFRQIQQKYLLVLYRQDARTPRGEKPIYRLSDVAFWQMPERHIPKARDCYELMRSRTIQGEADNPVKSTENDCCHVRPHGRNARDCWDAPDGNGGTKLVQKSSFWFNQKYLKSEIERLTTSSLSAPGVLVE